MNFYYACNDKISFNWCLWSPPALKSVHACARASSCMSRSVGPGIGMFCLKHDMVKTGKLWSEERVLQRRGSAVLSQLPAHLGTAAHSSQLTSWRRAQRAGCACANKTVWKTYFTLRGVHSLTIHRRGSGPLALFFLSLSLALFSPAPDYPCCRPTQNLRTADTLCSLLFLALSLSSLALPWAKHGFYILLTTEVCCGSGKLVEGCCGFLANTFE